MSAGTSANIAPTFASDVAPLRWYCPPPTSQTISGVLTVEPAKSTDYWSNTFYGFPDPQPHNGHFLFTEVSEDFVCEATVRSEPANRYDQAGLMVQVPQRSADGAIATPTGPDHGCWLKASIEFIPDGPSHLGSVVTNGGYSDWATQDIPSGPSHQQFRIRRLGTDYIIESRPAMVDAGALAAAQPAWSQIRMAHLHADKAGAPVRIGLYACSPLGEGYKAHFTAFSIRMGRLEQLQ